MKNNTKYSKIIAGTMSWGSWGKKLSSPQMTQLVDQCTSLGITTFDHADIYGDYSTEARFGKAFEASTIERSKVQFISKCGIQMTSGRKNKVKHYQYDTHYIIQSVEQSLKNLKTDYLDLLLLHRPSPLMQPDGIAEAISSLQESGKIKEFGVSNFTPSQIALLESTIPVTTNQIEFSLSATDAMLDGTLDDALMNKRQVMAWSPLGNYFKENTAKAKRLKRRIEQLQGTYNVTATQLLLAWIAKHPAQIIPVVGTTDFQRLADSVAALHLNLDLQDWFLLLEASQGTEVA